MFHIFYFLQSDVVFGIINPFSWILNAVSSGKSCPTSMPFLLTYVDVRTAQFLPPAESWLVNSNFRRTSRIQGTANNSLTEVNNENFISNESFR